MKKIIKALPIGLLLILLSSCQSPSRTNSNSTLAPTASDTTKPTIAPTKDPAGSNTKPTIVPTKNPAGSTTKPTIVPTKNPTDGGNNSSYVSPITNVKYRKNINYGSKEEKALETSMHINNGILSIGGNSDKKSKLRRYASNIPYQTEGLDGYFSYHDYIDDGYNKGLQETLGLFNTIMYGILVSGENIDFEGVTFIDQNSSSKIRIDTIRDNTYMLTNSKYVYVIGQYNGNDYYIYIDLFNKMFQYAGSNYLFTYSSSSKNLCEESDIIINHIRDNYSNIDFEALKYVFEKCYDDSQNIILDSLLAENVNSSLKTRGYYNQYYKSLSTEYAGYKKPIPEVYYDQEGEIIDINRNHQWPKTLEIPSGTKRITSLDNRLYSNIKLESIYIPNTLESISDKLLKTVNLSVVFCEYTKEQMPNELLDSLSSYNKEIEIYYADEFSIDEFNTYLPNYFYIRSSQKNINDIQIKDLMSNIKDYTFYNTILDINQKNDLRYNRSKLYEAIYNASSIEEIEELISNYNNEIEEIIGDLSSIDVLKSSINALLNANSYNLTGSFYSNNYSYTIREDINNSYISYYILTDENGHLAHSTSYLYNVNDNYYHVKPNSDDILPIESKEAFFIQYPYTKILNKILEESIDNYNIIYDDTNDLYKIFDNKSVVNLKIIINNGYISKIEGSTEKYEDLLLRYSYIDTNVKGISEYELRRLPSENDKYKLLGEYSYDLLKDSGYLNTQYYLFSNTYSEIIRKETEEEKNQLYAQRVDLLLSYVNYDLYNVYYMDGENKVYYNPGDIITNYFVVFKTEHKDINAYIKNNALKYSQDYDFDEVVDFSITINSEYYSYYVSRNENGDIRVSDGYNTSYLFKYYDGKYIVIIDNKFIEITDDLLKYNNILQYKDYYKMVSSINDIDKNFVSSGSNSYHIENYEPVMFNGQETPEFKITISDISFTVETRDYRITITKYGYPIEVPMTDIELSIISQYIK